MPTTASTLAAAVLACAFAWAAAAKLVQFKAWGAALDGYRIPRSLHPVALVGLPVAEIVVTVLLLAGPLKSGAALAVALVAVFSMAIIRARSLQETSCRAGASDGPSARLPPDADPKRGAGSSCCCRAALRHARRGGSGAERLIHRGCSSGYSGRPRVDLVVVDGSPGRKRFSREAVMSRARIALTAIVSIAVLAAPALAGLAGIPDPNDTRGDLDVRKVERFGIDRPGFHIVTCCRWRTKGIWDRGYFLVRFDTFGVSASTTTRWFDPTGGRCSEACGATARSTRTPT